MKKSLVAVAITSLLLIGGATVAVGSTNTFSGGFIAGNELPGKYDVNVTKTIELDEGGLGVINSTTNYPIQVKAVNAIKTDKVIALNNAGTFENIGEFKGLKSITINYTVSGEAKDGLTIDYGFNLKTGEKQEYVGKADVIKSGVTYNFDARTPSFFRLTATADNVVITSMLLNYTCEETIEKFDVDLSKYMDVFNGPGYGETYSRKFDSARGILRIEAEQPTSHEGNCSFGSKVGYMANSTLNYEVTSKHAETVLLTGNFASGNKDGFAFKNQYTVSVNGAVQENTTKAYVNGSGDWNWCIMSVIGEINLVEGKNTITFKSSEGLSDFDYFQLVPLKSINATTYDYIDGMAIYANEMRLHDVGMEDNKPNNAGWIGNNSKAEFNIVTSKALDTELFINAVYDNGNRGGVASKYIKHVYLNGKDVDISKSILDDGGEGEWYKRPYRVSKLADLSLVKGNNNIRIEFEGYMNFRGVFLGTAQFDNVNPLKIEAEDTFYNEFKPEMSANNEYVIGNASDKSIVKFTFNSAVECDVKLDMTDVAASYDNNTVANRLKVFNNDVQCDTNGYSIHVDTAGDWWNKPCATTTIANIHLNKGLNTILITLNSGNINIDSFTINPISK